MKKEKEIIGFEFQTIPLAEAQQAAMAGNGNYAELKDHLLGVLPNLKAEEAYAFGLKKGEVAEDQRRAICTVLNSTIKKAKLPWRVTYSSVKKLFICVPPETPRTYTKHTNGARAIDQPKTVERLGEICLKLWNLSHADFASPKKNAEISPCRKAMQFVGWRTLKLRAIDIGNYFGTSKDAVAYNCNHLYPRDKVHVGQLLHAIRG